MRGDGTVFAEGIGGYIDAATDGTRDFAASDGDAAKVLRAVIVGDEVDGAAIGGKAGAAHAAVEGERQHFGFAAGGRSDGEMVGGVDHGLDVSLGDVGDPFAVGRPRGLAVRAGIGGDLGGVGSLIGAIGGDDPDVRVVVAVGVGSAVTGKS